MEHPKTPTSLKKDKIFVIIVTYNGMKWIEKSLSCLRVLTYPVTTVVIDNGSTDGTREFISSRFPEVVWLPQKKNIGFGQGNNVGMRYALEHHADYVLLLNQDAYLQPTAIEEMLRVADGVNMITPVHLCGDGSRIDTMFRESLKRSDNQLFDDFFLCDECKQKYDIGEVCAACWFIPVSVLQVVGGFNPLFFQYGEDNNYYSRLIYHGRNIILSTKSFVWHDRKIHGNEKLWHQKFIHLRTLLIACDPNLNVIRRIKKWIAVWAEAPLKFPLELMMLIPKVPKIIKFNREEKIKKACWL